MMLSASKSGGWFRLWSNGPGLSWLHDSERPLFSERYGYRRYVRLWPTAYRIGWLAKGKS